VEELLLVITRAICILRIFLSFADLVSLHRKGDQRYERSQLPNHGGRISADDEDNIFALAVVF
jgi:hypothetical protein